MARDEAAFLLRKIPGSGAPRVAASTRRSG